MSSLHRLLLCRPAVFAQTLWVCGQTPCSRRVPLLCVPEQDLCEYILSTTSSNSLLVTEALMSLKASKDSVIISQTVFQSHVLVSAIGDAFRAAGKEENLRGGRDLIVEALRHKVSSTFCDTSAPGLDVFSYCPVVHHYCCPLCLPLLQNKMLQKENSELKRRLAEQTDQQ